jgi:hypothetical protein
VWFRFFPTFRRNVSPPSSGQVESTGSQLSTYCRLVVRVRNMFNKIKNRKEFPLHCKPVIVYPVYKGKEKKVARKVQRNLACIGMWKNIFGNPGWQTKRLVNISQSPPSVLYIVCKCRPR